MNDNINWGTLCGLIGIIGAAFLLRSCYLNNTDPQRILEAQKEKVQQEKNDKLCKQPTFVSEIDGIKLYKIMTRGCRSFPEDIIYFSTSGTNKSWRESHGKTSIQRKMQVPNSDTNNPNVINFEEQP